MIETNGGFLQLWQAYCDKKEEVEDLKEQRAELLEALKKVMPHAVDGIEQYGGDAKNDADIIFAKAAITKAEEAE